MNLQSFQTPPKSYRPMVRWWWPGLDVEKEELLRELDDLDRSGLGGAELQPFMIGSPTDMETKDPERARRTHRFMNPWHYEVMGAVLDGAEQRGLIIDITQNSAWPTGGTHIGMEDSHQTLLFGETVVRGPLNYEAHVPPVKRLRLYTFFGKVIPLVLKFPEMLAYYPEDKKLVRVVAGRLNGPKGKFTSWQVKASAQLEMSSMVDLTSSVDSGGRLRWQVPEGNWQIFAFYEGTAGAYPLLDVRSEPGGRALVLNHFSEAATRRHLEAFIGQGKKTFGRHFGHTLRAIFTDSFELLSPMHWNQNFIEEFKKRRGYDITPYLPVTYIPLKDVGYYTYNSELNLPNFDFAGGYGERIRYDFQRTVSELFIDEFIRGTAAWATENGIQSRVQGYGMLADPLCMLGYSHIPETEQLYGGGALHFLKLTGSAASLYARPVVTAETLVWSGRPYMTTPLKWRVGIDRLYESGINQAIYHGFPYRHPAFPFPGFQPFSSPYIPTGLSFSSDMSRDNPLLFGSAPHLNAYGARAQYLLQSGKTRAKVGLFYALFDYPNGSYIKEELVQGVLDEQDAQLPTPSFLEKKLLSNKPPSRGDRLWIYESAKLGNELVANGYYYQFFNEDSLLKAEVREGRAVMGEAEFEALVVFKETVLPAAAAEKLAELAAAGVQVLWVGSQPGRDPGFFDHEQRDKQVQAAVEKIGSPVLESAAQVVTALHTGSITPQIGYDRPQTRLGFIHKIDRENGTELWFLRNRIRQEQTVSFTLQASSQVPVEFDLWNGTVARLPYEPLESGALRLALTLAGYTSRMIALMDRVEAAALPMAARDLSETDLKTVQELGNFAFSAQQRLVDGSTRPVSLNMPALIDWRSHPELAGLGGPGVYQLSFSVDQIAAGERYFLCFSQVCDRADITLNGQALPPLLVMPWRCEVTEAIKEGENKLTITVTSTLRNMLVSYGNSGSPLYKQYRKQVTMPAGLIGTAKLCKFRLP